MYKKAIHKEIQAYLEAYRKGDFQIPESDNARFSNSVNFAEDYRARSRRALFDTTSAPNGALVRDELSLAVIEGENAVENLVGEVCVGPLAINYRNAHYVKLALGDALQYRNIAGQKYVRGPGTKYERYTTSFHDGTLTVTPRGVEILIPQEVMLDYRGRFDVMAFFAKKFGEEISGLTKEVLVANALQSTSIFGSATNSINAYTYANGLQGATNPISFITDAQLSSRRIKAKGSAGPFYIVMSGVVFDRIRQAYSVQGWATGALQPGSLATKDTIITSLRAFGIVDILIADSYSNTSSDSVGSVNTVAPNLVQNWSTAYFTTFVPGNKVVPPPEGSVNQTTGVSVPTIRGVGCLAFWEGFDNAGVPSVDSYATQFPGGTFVKTYPSNELNSTVIQFQMSHQAIITQAICGDIVATQYA